MSREQDVRAVIERIAESFSKLDVIRWLSFFNHQHTFGRLEGRYDYPARRRRDLSWPALKTYLP